MSIRTGRACCSAKGSRRFAAAVKFISARPVCRRDAVELATADRGHDVWRVEAGDTLRAVLERWGARAGTEVLFLTDRRYRLHRSQAFEGAFIDAVRTLFFALSHLPHPPAGEFTAGGKSLAVTHRAPQIPANGGKP